MNNEGIVYLMSNTQLQIIKPNMFPGCVQIADY